MVDHKATIRAAEAAARAAFIAHWELLANPLALEADKIVSGERLRSLRNEVAAARAARLSV